MKKLSLTIIAVMMAIMSYAQKNLIATLNHDGSISTYYGISAFINAYEAAKDGDVITLSSGKFSANSISKAIIIRGAGMEGDEITTIGDSYGNLNIYCPKSEEKKLIIEGVCVNGMIGGVSNEYKLVNIIIKKCKISNVYVYEGSNFTMMNSRITNCIDVTGVYANQAWNDCNVTCINSIICNPYKNSDNSSFNFINCIIYFSNPFWGAGAQRKYADLSHLTYSLFENSFIFSGSTSFPTSCIVNNSTGISSDTDIFKTFEGTFSANEIFELTDEAKETYIGSDETEMGVHGGLYPWKSLPSYPLITKFEVAKKAYADGKLSVDIVVNGVE